LERILTSFDRELGILILNVVTDLTPRIVINYYRDLEKKKKYPRDLKVLCFVTAKNYLVQPGDIGMMVESLRSAAAKYNMITEAFVAEDPYITVLTTLFSEKAKIRNYRSAVFSTREAALKWLEV